MIRSRRSGRAYASPYKHLVGVPAEKGIPTAASRATGLSP
jgi:hypothetical protein